MQADPKNLTSSGGLAARKGVLLALAVSLLAALVFGVTLAQGAKEVMTFFGVSGSAGAQFSTPRDVAVNESGAGAADVGDVYVADDANHRVQVFDSEGDFKFAFGRNVIAASGAGDLGDVFERCVVAADCQAGSFGTTADGPAGEFDNPQGVAVNQSTGGVYVRDRDNRRVQQFDAAGNFVRAWGFGVATGVAAFEVCTVSCLPGLTGAGGGQFATTSTNGTGIAVSPATQDVFVGDPQNRRVLQFESDGDFVRGWGWDVDTSDGASTNVFEVCAAACRAGQNAVPNTSNGQFGAGQPLHLAVDAAGVVYASDSTSANRVVRFDADLAGAAGNATAALMTAIAAPPLLTGATSGLEVDPDSDAGGSDEDVLHVLRDPTTGNTVVQQFGPVNDPGAAVAPTGADDTHGAGAGFTTTTGLGIDSATNRLFVSTTAATVGASGHRVYVLGEAPAPTASIDSVDTASTSATVEGSIDANGAQTGYHFEFSTDGGSTWTNRPTGNDLPVGSGDDAEDVSYQLEGLDPGTDYSVRLVAKQVFGTAAGISNVETFTTDAAAPVVGPLSADAGATDATLTGRIDPSGEATTYRFEYGPTTDYGNEAPVPDGDLPAGDASVPVMADISDLEPATTYHYRLVAENDTGVTEGADHVFATGSELSSSCPNEDLRLGASSRLPGCRAYEQVSPVDKNGGDVAWTSGTVSGGRTVAEDGTKAMFASLTEFAGGPSGGSLSPSPYVARRTTDGWTTSPMLTRSEPEAAGAEADLSSADLGRSLLKSSGVLESDPPDPLNLDINLYMRDNDAGVTSPFAAIAETSGTGTGLFFAPVASPDMESVVFVSTAVLTADPGIPTSSFTQKVYEKAGGQIRLVSVLPDGTPVPSTALPAGAPRNPGTPSSTVGGVSDDGDHVFFSSFAGSTPDAVYRRDDGATTALVSPSQREVADPAGARGKRFEFATPDGDRVFFSSAEMLTDDANTGPGPTRPGNDLYRYDVEDDELVDISATSGGNGADVVHVLGFDDAGDRVYYVARGAVVPGDGPGGDPDPVPGEPNVYLWEDDGTARGTTRLVATLSPADSSNWFNLGGRWTARTTPDGAQLVFQSEASLPGSGGAGVVQVYRYDTEAGGGAGELVCVSCNPSGNQPIGPSSVPRHVLSDGVQRWELPRALSEDGRRVFFDSEDALVPGDSNGEIDAYMWEDGEVNLLSTGTSETESHFYNASRSGDDAFILTDQALVTQDKDDLVDLYDARVGGGFPSAPDRPDCDGDECQEGSMVPPPGDAGSTDIHSAGDVESRLRLVLGLRRPAGTKLARLVRGRKVGLRVHVTRSAKVTVVVRARVGGRRRIVARGRARARKAGNVVVGLRLSKQARRQLGRKGAMSLSLRASAPGARSQSLTLRLRTGR